MPETELVLLEEGNVVQSFSGVDFNVLGYIPPYNKNDIEELSDTTTSTGDVFFHRMSSLQTLSISSTRDHKAARRLGSAWAFDFSRGSRTIAGSLVFAMINGDAFKHFVDATNQYAALSREDAGQYLPDALPPFNIAFTASNESGTTLVGMLIGVRLTNTGMSFGIHDIYTEQVYSFVAERYEPLNDFTDNLLDTISPSSSILSIDAELAIRSFYNDVTWYRPKLEAVDNYTRGVTDRGSDRVSSKWKTDLDKIYRTPSDKLNHSERNPIQFPEISE